MMDEEIRQALSEVREMKQMCGNINMKLTNIVTQRGQDWKKKLEAEYQRGFEDAHRISEEEYHRGLEDGKAQIELGCEGCKHEGSSRALSPCHYCTRNSTDCWTAKQTDDKIEVGDVVIAEEGKTVGIVTKEWDGRYYVMWQDGSSGLWLKESVRKTDKHFDIVKILEEMQS